MCVYVYKSYDNLDQFLVSAYFQYSVFIAKTPSFAVTEDGKCKCLRLKFQVKRNENRTLKKILGFRLLLMTLPVGLAVLAMKTEFYAKFFFLM